MVAREWDTERLRDVPGDQLLVRAKAAGGQDRSSRGKRAPVRHRPGDRAVSVDGQPGQRRGEKDLDIPLPLDGLEQEVGDELVFTPVVRPAGAVSGSELWDLEVHPGAVRKPVGHLGAGSGQDLRENGVAAVAVA